MIQALMIIVEWCKGPIDRNFATCPVCALQHRVSKIYRKCRHTSLTFKHHCSLKHHCQRQHLHEGSFECNRCGSHQASAHGLAAHWICKHRDWYFGASHGMVVRLMNSARANSQCATIQDFAVARSHVSVYLHDSRTQHSQWLVALSSCLVNMGWSAQNIALALAMLKRHEPFSQAISLRENTMLIAHWALELIPQSPNYQYHQVAFAEAKLKTLGERLHNQGFPFARNLVYKTKRIQNRNLVEPKVGVLQRSDGSVPDASSSHHTRPYSGGFINTGESEMPAHWAWNEEEIVFNHAIF